MAGPDQLSANLVAAATVGSCDDTVIDAALAIGNSPNRSGIVGS